MTNGSAKKLIEPPLRYLTKSLVRTALTCPRKLVYASNPKKYPKQDSIREDPFLKHLADEGKRFGDYCRRLFPHGVEIGSRDIYNTSVEDDSLDTYSEELVTQTKDLLAQQQHHRVTLFEGAVRHEHFYIRPDILDRIIQTNRSNSQVELRVIEVKTKSYDSRPGSKGGQIWIREKKSIRGNFLPYIQDVAFQSMVVRRAFPEYNVTAWLMLPDRAKILTLDRNTTCDITNDVPTVEDTLNAINDSTATLVNVDELVQVALSSKPAFPGSYGQSFEKVIHKWAEQFCYKEERDLSTSFLDVPIGSHCALCKYKYRIEEPPIEPSDENDTKPISGFDVCWENATGLSPNQLEKPLIIDLYGYTKTSTAKFIEENKFLLDDLCVDDFPTKKDAERGEKIPSHIRQWFQVSYLQPKSVGKAQRVVLMRDIIQRKMNGWQYPWHFIDFETSSPVLPYYPGMAPYEIFAFQFSHHIIHEDQRHVLHHATEFLHTERDVCPNRQFLQALYNALGSEGTVFQWSPFETTVLQSLLSSQGASSLPFHEKESLSGLLVDGSRSMVDLCKLASDYYYVDGSGGSSSIKKLLAPTMNASRRLKDLYGRPNYNSNNFKNWQWYQLDESGQVINPYKLLETKPNDNDELYIEATRSVTHGGAASTAFHLLQCDGVSQQGRQDIETALLRYCELDTLSMAMIVQAWQGFIDNEDC